MNGTFAPATVSAAEVDFLDLLEKEEADFADQGGYSVVGLVQGFSIYTEYTRPWSCASHRMII